MHRGGQAPRPANDIKHGKKAVVGLAEGFWPISNTPLTIMLAQWRGAIDGKFGRDPDSVP
jgi:hypothetical protein